MWCTDVWPICGFLIICLLSGSSCTPEETAQGVKCGDNIPVDSCQLPKEDGNQHICTTDSKYVCKERTFVEEGAMCSFMSKPGLTYYCDTGQWALTDAGTHLQRPERLVATVFAGIGVAANLVSLTFQLVCTFVRCGPKPPPPNKPPTITCPESISRLSEIGKLAVTVTWKPPTVYDPEETISPKQTSDLVSGSSFNEGNHVVTYIARDSQGLSDFCSFQVTVKVPSCSRLPNPEHGNIDCTGEEPNIHGSTCTVKCKRGYELEHTRKVTCGENRKWSDGVPACKAVSCGDPVKLINGQLSCSNGNNFPSVCSATCDHGYRLRNGSPLIIRCQEDRSWTQPTPACVDNQPPNFPSGCPLDRTVFSGPLASPANVSWTEPNVTDNSLQKITLDSSHKNGGQLDVGTHTIKITATDAVGNMNFCNFVVIVKSRECPQLMSPANGALTCTSSVLEGSTCTVKCIEGYQSQGNAVLTCLNTSQWDSMVPACQAVNCGPPQSISGQFGCLGQYVFQTICLLQCDQGFSVRGSSYVQCLANGSWTIPGSCHDTLAPVFDACPEDMEVYASRLGEETFATWTVPTVSDNSKKVVQLTSDHTPGQIFPVGVTKVAYTATDTSNNTARCQFSVTVTSLVCNAPELEPSNRTNSIMLYTCAEGYVYGATCGLTCSYGYPLNGGKTITCEADNSTFPPRMNWVWPGSFIPHCVANNCSKLDPPLNGALACNLGNYGWDCLMSCNDQWDVPNYVDGHFYCTNSMRQWVPATVPNCEAEVKPFKGQLHSKVFYYAGSCNDSLDELKENFIIRMKNSTKLKDACVSVPSCVVENVQVTCGPETYRRKRAGIVSVRERRQTTQNIIVIDFDISVETDNSSSAAENYQELLSLRTMAANALEQEVRSGFFNIGDHVADSVSYPTLAADCPPGTQFVQRQITSRLTCTGCGVGHYLPEGSTQCEACPVGSYTELSNATSCTLCPPDWSTPTTGSKNSTDCKELCVAGTMSPDGFMPCQPCPPGSYQTRSGATTCDACPVGTWSASENAANLDQCIVADVHLTTRPLTASVNGGWSSLTLTCWYSLRNNASANIKFDFQSGDAHVSLFVYTTSTNEDAVPQYSGTSTLPSVSADTWTKLAVTFDPQNSNISIFHQHSLVKSVRKTFSQPTQGIQIAVTPISGRVVISGLHAAPLATTDPYAESPARTCCENAANHFTAWTPPPGTLRMPSECDAMDECLAQPCGSHLCENRVDGFVCHCQDGWSGDTCSTPPDPCYHTSCRQGSTCVSGVTNYTCICQGGFAGPLCNLIKVDGGWGGWSTWSDCSATCGGGRQHRQRLCNNPAPLNGGAECVGSDNETSACGEPNCPVNGNWSAWTEWTDCSASCNGGERTRTRNCDNPFPQFGGRVCDGVDVEQEACNTAFCIVHGGFGSWSNWTQCSATCGDGYMTRSRLCDSPTPAHGGRPCKGDYNQTAQCNNGECPVCSTLFPSNTTILECNETMSPYLQTCNLTCAPGYVTTIQFPLYQCGEKTGYLWNHERTEKKNTTLPVCTVPYFPKQMTLHQVVPMNTGCNDNVAYSVRNKVEENSVSLPCIQKKTCTANIATTCVNTMSQTESQGSLVVQYELTVRLEPSITEAENESAIAEEYMNIIITAGESAAMLVQSKTEQIFTVTVDGEQITPNLSAVTHDGVVECPQGFALMNGVCTGCPVGHKEENHVCVPCPFGQYQDEPTSSDCKLCLDGTTWDVLGAVSADQCVSVECPRPTSDTQGEFSCPDGHGFSASCSLQCHTGYRINGTSTISCQRDGTWTTARSCQESKTTEETPSAVPAEEFRRVKVAAIVGGVFAGVAVVAGVVVTVVIVQRRRHVRKKYYVTKQRHSLIPLDEVSESHEAMDALPPSQK